MYRILFWLGFRFSTICGGVFEEKTTRKYFFVTSRPLFRDFVRVTHLHRFSLRPLPPMHIESCVPEKTSEIIHLKLFPDPWQALRKRTSLRQSYQRLFLKKPQIWNCFQSNPWQALRKRTSLRQSYQRLFLKAQKNALKLILLSEVGPQAGSDSLHARNGSVTTLAREALDNLMLIIQIRRTNSGHARRMVTKTKKTRGPKTKCTQDKKSRRFRSHFMFWLMFTGQAASECKMLYLGRAFQRFLWFIRAVRVQPLRVQVETYHQNLRQDNPSSSRAKPTPHVQKTRFSMCSGAFWLHFTSVTMQTTLSCLQDLEWSGCNFHVRTWAFLVCKKIHTNVSRLKWNISKHCSAMARVIFWVLSPATTGTFTWLSFPMYILMRTQTSNSTWWCTIWAPNAARHSFRGLTAPPRMCAKNCSCRSTCQRLISTTFCSNHVDTRWTLCRLVGKSVASPNANEISFSLSRTNT